ncbi:fluoride efflux transporter FluC [Paeniglutamicibacter sp. MACA_103]|uniref:fluoride efflux transporter FluC n=1 Tax=Paeniglutamicibacter sp. MACA_103 TaxID=3377337 RepID=UPI003895679B
MGAPNKPTDRDDTAPAKAPPRATGLNIAAVAVGGFCGAALRVGLGLWIPDAPGIPATTLAINVTGTAALAALTSYWQITHRGPSWLRAGIGTGFLGAFTTFSAVVLFALGASPAEALLDLVFSLLLCAAAAWVAMSWVERALAGSGASAPSGRELPQVEEPGTGGTP